ncbi:DUF885 domain-containing protein [Chryseosolibacter indicus]|uniref:DUF885 family protein n=1 Tax=Chryseosolibacter indicus TaxID=2782351 RepID=A0ABS5VTY3_9BACT|nr:DUF885 domain-containing protein [Chryseosolibacter indicus]MBT1704300.1 DUF885 family protein [Chryseosolibacter indicus]
MKYLSLLSIVVFLTAKAFGQTTVKNESLQRLFDKIEKFTTSAEDSLYLNYHPRGEWSPVSYESQVVRADSLKKYIAALEHIADNTLSNQEKISKALMLMNLNDEVDAIKYKIIFIPFTAEGGFYNRLSYILPRLAFNSLQHYYDYLAWLPKFEKVLQENMVLMKTGVREGIVAPKVIVNNNLQLLKPWTPDKVQQSPFYLPITNLPQNFKESDKLQIRQRAEEVIGRLLTTYKQLNKFFSTEYMSAAKDKPGIMFIPKGREYYENRVRHYTTLPLSADSIHALGLSEVSRIRAEMDKIINDLKFKGSFKDFISFLRMDPQFYAKTPQELLNYASWLSKKAEGQLPKFFNTLYNLPFTVEPVPESIASTYTAGRYVPGSWKAKRAGIYWVNTYDLKSRPLYAFPALTLHEAVPGHHLQGAITAELKDIPTFRNNYYISAFGEGWGLYCEFLGEEMGMYVTPYDLFGRYTYEMWRACRLVVDTGIHYKGWSRDEALKYLGENTALSIHEVTTEIDRYIGWPGQALSYKVGELKIRSLRKKAETSLASDFKIGEFHQAILQNGSVPLSILEMQVDEYIKNMQGKLKE